MTGPVCGTCLAAWSEGHRCTSGADLAHRRNAAGLSQADVAEAWITPDHPKGVSAVYVSKVERQAAPTATTRAAYLAALRKAQE